MNPHVPLWRTWAEEEGAEDRGRCEEEQEDEEEEEEEEEFYNQYEARATTA